jgi:uncharacterized protein (TIGR03435 family)
MVKFLTFSVFVMVVGVTALTGNQVGIPGAQPAAGPPPAFEAASVKPNKSGDAKALFQVPPGGRLNALNVRASQLITFAYQILDTQLVGAPDWVTSERFDVVAKLGGEPPAATAGTNAVRLALQSLLAERFKLAAHRETREIPIYALVTAKSDRAPGRMLKISTADCSPEAVAVRRAAGSVGGTTGFCGSRFLPGHIRFGGFPLSEFAKVMTPHDGRIVVDRTGLTGNWDFELTFTPDGPVSAAPGQELPKIDPNGPSIFTALQEQLGLKLEPTRGPGEVLVIDRVEQPTPD